MKKMFASSFYEDGPEGRGQVSLKGYWIFDYNVVA